MIPRPLLAVVLLVAPASLAAPRPPAPRPTRPKSGASVQYTTAKHAFLNRGSADGLEVGATVKLTRGSIVASTCTVDSVTDHSASCQGGGARPGDGFKMEGGKAPPPFKPRAALPSSSEIASRRASLDGAARPLVDFVGSEGKPLIGGDFTADAAFTHSVWAAFGQSNGTFQSEQLDVALRGLDLTHGMRLSVDLTAVHWSQRPTGYRLPQSSDTVLYLRQTEISHRDDGASLMASVGRLYPVNAPGAGVIDGLQAGWRTGNLEVGAFGGEIPEPYGLKLSTQNLRWTAGAYFAWETANEGEATVNFFKDATRLAYVYAPEFSNGGRPEVETQVQARFINTWDLVSDLRLGVGNGQTPGPLETARVDLSAHASNVVSFSADLRYVALQPTDFLSLGETTYEHRGLHADAYAHWLAAPWIAFSAMAGVFRDFDNPSQERLEAGPEVRLPTLFGSGAGLSAGYLFEYGWLGMRNTYLQASFVPVDRLRLLIRGSYVQDTPTALSGFFTTRQLGESLTGEFAINKHLYVRLAASFFEDLGGGLGGDYALRQSTPSGLNGSATLGGQL